MLTASIFTITGILVSFILGYFLKIPPDAILKAIVASNIAGFASLLMVTFGHQSRSFKKYIIPGPTMTWLAFSIQYFAVLYLLTPEIRQWPAFVVLAVPLICCTGFAILLFGPIRDWIMRVSQSKSK